MNKILYLRSLDADREQISKLYNDVLLICDIERYPDLTNQQRLAKEVQQRVEIFFQRAIEKLNTNSWGVFERTS